MSKNIFITGASGFLGRHLLQRIKDDEQFKVFALSSHPDQMEEKLGYENITYLYKDTIFGDTLGPLLKDALVINCAYPRNSTGTEIADGLKYIQRVFESAVKREARAIINISSQSVYSQQRADAATEETPVSLESPYAVGKYAVELMLESICKESGTCYTSLRMASLIGPGFDQRIVNRFVRQAIAKGYLDVDMNNQNDAVLGIYKILYSNEHNWKHIYNLGRIESYTVYEIANSIKEVLLNKGVIETKLNIHENEKTGNSSLRADLFMREFTFQPGISLEESIVRIVDDIIH